MRLRHNGSKDAFSLVHALYIVCISSTLQSCKTRNPGLRASNIKVRALQVVSISGRLVVLYLDDCMSWGGWLVSARSRRSFRLRITWCVKIILFSTTVIYTRTRYLCWIGRCQMGNDRLCKPIYRVGGPKMAQFFLYSLTSSNLNRFSKLFHCQNQAKTCNNTTIKDPTTP